MAAAADRALGRVAPGRQGAGPLHLPLHLRRRVQRRRYAGGGRQGRVVSWWISWLTSRRIPTAPSLEARRARAQAAPTDPRAHPEHLGSLPRHPQLGPACAQDEDTPLFKPPAGPSTSGTTTAPPRRGASRRRPTARRNARGSGAAGGNGARPLLGCRPSSPPRTGDKLGCSSPPPGGAASLMRLLPT